MDDEQEGPAVEGGCGHSREDVICNAERMLEFWALALGALLAFLIGC